MCFHAFFDRQEWLKTCCVDAFAHTFRPPETFFQKRYFLPSEVVKLCFDAFAHTSRPPETFFQKRYFLLSGVVKSVFWCICTYFQNTRNLFSKEIFFTVWSGYKRVFLLLRILPDYQKLFLKKRYFLPSGVVKNVFWCICTCLQTTRNFFF